MSDPRVNPAITSITRVEVPEDLLTARVFVSVAADEKTQRRTVLALQHAAGYLQEALAQRVRLRHTPKLDFEQDLKFKKTVEVLNLISEVSEEIRQKDLQREASSTHQER